jgi:condensin complex subunit 2
MGDHTAGDDFGGDDLGSGEYNAEDGKNGSVDAQAGLHPAGTEGGRNVAFDPRRAPNERALIMAMTDADGDGGMLDYFDQSLLKNWAGPEHWKLRKAVRRRSYSLPFSIFIFDTIGDFCLADIATETAALLNLSGRRKRHSRSFFYLRQ